MICKKCCKGKHKKCKGGTWCDCQHQTRVKTIIERDALSDNVYLTVAQ